MKKRFLTGFLAAVLCLSAVGCGSASAPAGDTAKAGNESAKETEGNAKEAGEKAADVSWPDGNVNLIVAAAAGGGTDLVARKVAEIAKKETGANFIVVNQAEGGGAVAIDTVYQDDEDALNLGFFIPSFFTSYITGAVDVNPLDDFKVANYVNRESCAYICVKADSKYKTMEELLDDARKNPESIVFGTSLGSRSHFRVEEFAQAAGVKFKYVEAGKTAEAILGGQLCKERRYPYSGMFGRTDHQKRDQSGSPHICADGVYGPEMSGSRIDCHQQKRSGRSGCEDQ